ncbi:F-box/LRR-repeat protein 3-like [Vicia villosa]|uniref:F-box/LRR-repeat protein 3-like n=1 Tax=Vicia villosa TaxID=3911 RepID=UPI00273A7976|nr:F-box/LRR-repeat protein 3-like [Vicia villosa]
MENKKLGGEKFVEVARDRREVKGSEVGKPLKEEWEEIEGWLIDSEREMKTVGDGGKKTCIKSDDCWEHVFKFLINCGKGETANKHNRDFNSLSLVSKQFLSITNRLTFSVTISDHPSHILPRFFHRFPNLNSLHLCFGSSHLDPTIALALRDRPTLKSLSIFSIELKDANCVTSHYIDSFKTLKGLNILKFCYSHISDDLLYSIAAEQLPLKNFVLNNCTGYSYDGIYCLLSKCPEIQHLDLHQADFLKDGHIHELSLFLGGLVSIKLCNCLNLSKSALFALIRNCRSLTEITMERIGRDSGESFDSSKDFDVNPHLKFLCLARNCFIENKNIILLASIFPNLQHLDLSYCYDISEKSICQVLSRCSMIRHLNLAYCNKVRRLKMNFVVPHLEVLNLSDTNVNDKTLYQISKSCCGLLQLLLSNCSYVTKKGVMRIMEHCTQLKEIDLRGYDEITVDGVVPILPSKQLLL